MIKLELSTRTTEGYSGALMVGYALMAYHAQIFKELEDMNEEEKRDRYPSLFIEVELLSHIYSELTMQLATEAAKVPRVS